MPANNLYAVLMTGQTSANGTSSVTMPIPATALPGYTLTGFFKATALDSGDVVIAFADASTNQGVTCALLSVNLNTAAILAGPTLSITTGTSMEAYSAISIVTIGTGSQFMVMFIDLIVSRAVVAAIGQVIPTLYLHPNTHTQHSICTPAPTPHILSAPQHPHPHTTATFFHNTYSTLDYDSITDFLSLLPYYYPHSDNFCICSLADSHRVRELHWYGFRQTF